jgi:hypothetical protein
MIIFTHVPRTAGTSFRLVIEHNVAAKNILALYGNDIPNAREVVATKNLNNIQVIRGHIAYGVTPGEHDYVALLRHPMTRLASLYRYIISDKGHFAYHRVYTMSFHDFILSGVTAETDNGMVRQLCGIEDYQQVPYAKYKVPFGACGPEQLELALENLEKHYTVVGTQEQFGDFLLACQGQFGWTLPVKTPHANRTNRMTSAEPSGRTVQQAMTLNMYDLLLWDYARKRAAS